MTDLPDLPIEGSCLCGEVQIRASQLPILTLACHCTDCQKLTASAFSLTAMFPSNCFETLSGSLVIGGRKNEERRHHFCRQCLSFIYTQIVGKPERVNVRTSMFGNIPLLRPHVELMTEQKLYWTDVHATRSFNRFPTTSEEFDALVLGYAQWLRAQNKKGQPEG